MRPCRRCLIALLFLATVVGSRGDALPVPSSSAPLPTPVPVPPAARFTVLHVFSYVPPPGWVVSRLNGMVYPVAMEKKGADTGLGFTPAMITVNSDVAPLPLIEWCSKSLAKNGAQFAAMKAQIGELQSFPTATPAVSGYRAPIDLAVKDKKIHYVMYFFSGSGDTKIVVTCVCSAADADRYAPVFDAAMNTFYPY